MRITAFISLLLWIGSCYAGPKYELSICAIFRDEAPYLKEWIEFHRLMGAEYFYLCSHNSSDDYRKVLKPYIAKGIVELREIHSSHYEAIEDFNALQSHFYTECLNKAKESSKWIAFIDLDEFLFPTKADNLVAFLKDFKDCDGLAVNWQAFGTSGVAKLSSDKLMIEQLVRCAKVDDDFNIPIKSIVQPKFAVQFTDPHSPYYLANHYQVNTDREPFLGPMSPYIQVDQLRINHYWTRDEYYLWNYKFPRRSKWLGWSAEGLQEMNDRFNEREDQTILRFVPKLRNRMGLPALF